jgi:hypothetical protein
MKIPGDFLNVFENFRNSRGSKENLVKSMELKEDTKNNMLSVLGKTDPFLLSFLWICMEEQRNMLLLADNSANANDFMDTLGILVPNHHTTQIIGKSNKFDNRLNFINAHALGNSIEGQIDVANRIIPDRIIIEKANEFLADVFELAKFGVSFVASVNGEFCNRNLIKKLNSEFKVNKNNMNMVDISVLIQEVNGIAAITGITEYKWLQRYEIKANEYDMIAKDYTNIRLMNESKLDIMQLDKSKIIEKYMRDNLIGIEDIYEELTKRAEFLKSLSNKENMRYTNPIEMYYEIK